MSNMTLTDFIKLLDAHDWHYEYSDDKTVWAQGLSERNAIIEAAQSLGPEAIALIRRLSPAIEYSNRIEFLMRDA